MKSMTGIPAREEHAEVPGAAGRTPGRLLAAGGAIGALLASSCCVVPLVLVTLGVSGAWIGNLTGLAPYKPYFLAATVPLIGTAFWYVYSKPRKACGEDAACTPAASGRMTKTVLWLAAGLALLAATVNFWAPLFY